jgi:hypothetical protein
MPNTVLFYINGWDLTFAARPSIFGWYEAVKNEGAHFGISTGDRKR